MSTADLYENIRRQAPQRPEAQYRAIRTLATARQHIVSSKAVEADRAKRMLKAAENKRLAEKVLEDLTDVQAQWLGNATPIVTDLIDKANDPNLSDQDFISAVQKMAHSMPVLFDKLDHKALAKAIEKATGAAIMNGMIERQREFNKTQKP